MGRVALPSGDFLAWSDVARWSGGCLVRLVVTSRRVYAKGDLPRMLLPVLSPQRGPADPPVHRRPSNTSRSLGSTSCGATALFLWVLVPARFCLTLQDKSLFAPGFPVLWKSCNQISLAFKVRFPGDSRCICQIPSLGSLTWCSKPSQQWGNFSVIIVLQIVVGIGFGFIMIVTLLLSLCSFFFVFERGVFSSGGFQGPPADGCSTASCGFGTLVGDAHTSSYSTFLNWKPVFSLSLILFF